MSKKTPKFLLPFYLCLLMTAFSYQAYALECENDTELECLHKHALDIYEKTKDKNDYPYIGADTILRFEAINGIEYSLDESLYFKGLDQNDRVKPLSQYHFYHLYNTKQPHKIIDYLAKTEPEDHSTPARINANISDRYIKSDARQICQEISQLMFKASRPDLLDALEEKTFCGENPYRRHLMTVKSTLALFDKNYHQLNQIYEECNGDDICHSMMTGENLTCLYNRFREKELSQEDKQILRQTLKIIDQNGAPYETSFSASGGLSFRGALFFFIELASWQEMEQALLSKEPFIHGVNNYGLRETLFRKIIHHIHKKWPEVTDEQLVSFINRLDELHMQKRIGKPIYINGYAKTLASQGFDKAAKAAAFAKSGMDRKNAPPSSYKQSYLIKKLYHQQEKGEDTSINYAEHNGAHRKCLNIEGKEFYRCLENAYIEVAKNKYNWPFDYKVRREVFMWRLKRAEFREAIELFDTMNNEINRLKTSFNFLNQMKIGKHRGIMNIRGFMDVEREMHIGQDIQNLDDKYFPAKQCMSYIEENPNVPFIFEEDPHNNTKFAMASIFIKCLTNLPLKTIKTYIQANDLYKEGEHTYFSNSFVDNIEYTQENDEKIQFFLQYPMLTSNMQKRSKEFIQNGYKRTKQIKITDKPLMQALEEISKYDDLKKKIYDIGWLVSHNIKQQTPTFPSKYQTCKVKY